jgi:hypothetical protein
MHRKIQMLQVLLFSLLTKKDVVVDKVPKQPMTHTDTHSIKIDHQSSYKR